MAKVRRTSTVVAVTPIDFGALVREARERRGWTQTVLGARIGASRFWVAEFERGKAGAELGLALRAVAAVGLRLKVDRPVVAAGGEAAALAAAPGREVAVSGTSSPPSGVPTREAASPPRDPRPRTGARRSHPEPAGAAVVALDDIVGATPRLRVSGAPSDAAAPSDPTGSRHSARAAAGGAAVASKAPRKAASRPARVPNGSAAARRAPRGA